LFDCIRVAFVVSSLPAGEQAIALRQGAFPHGCNKLRRRQFRLLQLFRLALDSRMRRRDKFFPSPLPCPNGIVRKELQVKFGAFTGYSANRGFSNGQGAVAALGAASQSGAATLR
jgi:hypothetical protein